MPNSFYGEMRVSQHILKYTEEEDISYLLTYEVRRHQRYYDERNQKWAVFGQFSGIPHSRIPTLQEKVPNSFYGETRVLQHILKYTEEEDISYLLTYEVRRHQRYYDKRNQKWAVFCIPHSRIPAFISRKNFNFLRILRIQQQDLLEIWPELSITSSKFTIEKTPFFRKIQTHKIQTITAIKAIYPTFLYQVKKLKIKSTQEPIELYKSPLLHTKFPSQHHELSKIYWIDLVYEKNVI